MQWFRFYNEFAFDPKIQTMSETLQRRFTMLLCLQSNDDLQKLTPNEIAFALRITTEDLLETKKVFIKKGFIDEEFTILNWDKRQYISDNSTQRVRKHRQKQDETLQKRSETVTVTPPEQIQNRTDNNIVEKESRPANNIPYKAIVSYLNEKANTHFKHDTNETKRLIKARINQGFDLKAFEYVIDVKCQAWLTDPNMVNYLRPQTLFGTKFESYLNEVLHE